MTPRSIIVYICAIGAVVATIIGGVIIRTNDGSQSSTSSSAPPPSSSTTPTATPVPTEFDEHAFDEGGELSACERDLNLLRSRSRLVAVAWNELHPSDTTSARQVRLAPLVVDSFFTTNEEKLEVYTDSEADKARIRQQATQTATISDQEVEVVCASNVSDEAATVVKVFVWSKDPAGTQLGPPDTMSMSITWKFQGSTWLATSIATT